MTPTASAPGYVALDKARDGTFLRIRSTGPDDRERLIETFRGGEFAAEPSIVATVWIEGRERIVGLASYFVDPWTEPRRAEAAVTVVDDWKSRGIGTVLFAHLARVARRAGVDELYADILPSNRSILRILHASGYPAEVDRSASDVRARVRLGRRVFA